MNLRKFLVLLLAGLYLPTNFQPALAEDGKQVDYASDIQPLFAKHCYSCHSAKKQESSYRLDIRSIAMRGGDLGESPIEPGDSQASTLIDYVTGSDESLRMPPEGEGEPLSADEIAILKKWIDGGANWPDELAGDHAKLTTDHWSFQPVLRPSVPVVEYEDWVANPIDAFVLQKLQQAGLSPSSPAERRLLIRRIYLDVLGLPPSPQQVDQFVADTRSDAYERLVKEVLDSPHYGERWARHWLDVVRFAETDGFETNRERPNAYPFRDYVIQSLNADKPYDQFVREQIAGDALGNDVATGFLVAGPHDIVKSPDINLTLMQRQDELADIVNTTGTTFLGLTVGCARCHNHKFDPITQKDYYSMQAVFAGVNHGERALALTDKQDGEAAELSKRISELRKKLSAFVPKSNEPFILIDDGSLSSEGQRGVEVYQSLKGKGKNPDGAERGQRNDPGSEIRSPNISGGEYSWWTNEAGKDVAAYRPIANGKYRVWLSWGCGFETHSTDAEYWLDRDGNIAARDDQVLIATIDQQAFAERPLEKLPGQPLWSGFYDAGVYDLEPNSAIVLRGGKHGTALTSDVLLLEAVNEKPDQQAAAAAIPRLRPAVNSVRNDEAFAPLHARFVRFTVLETNSSQPCIDELEIWSGAKNVALATNGGVATCSSSLPGYPIHQLKHVNDGLYGNSHSWISNEAGRGWVQIELSEPCKIDRIVWQRDREGAFRDRVATRYIIEAAVEPEQWKTIASSESRLPVSSTAVAQVQYQFDDSPTAQEAKRWLAEVEQLTQRRNALAATNVVYAGTFASPGPTYRLYRGDPMAKREEVAPDALEVISSLNLQKDAGEQMRRLELANWITNPENPLTARVIVNRIWQHHFGTGLVDTPSDFGANGTKPSHPELLDWLACELTENNWSLKHIHRLILMSNTYQQSSRPNPAGARVDADARLLWRYPPRRLEAEAMRDCILSVAGSLNPEMGGRGFSAFEVELENVRHYFPRKEWGPNEWRRMIYVTKVRQEQDATFGIFDCPDGAQVIPRRSRSTTPLQALNLLNSKFMIQQAEILAKRLAEEAGDDPEDQVGRAFELTFARTPDADELADSVEFIKQYDLFSFCRAMFNANEFLFIY